MNYWIFKCDPKKYSLGDRLEDPIAKTTWHVNEYEDKIKKGDIAFIWRAYKNIGILALMRIDSDPIIMEELPREIEFYNENFRTKNEIGERLRIEGSYLHRCELIPSKEIRESYSLSKISALTARRETNFELTKEQGEKLKKLFEERKNKNFAFQ